MLNKKIAKRYAKALFEIGNETNRIDQFREELGAFARLLTISSELKECLLSPLYPAADKKKIAVSLAEKTGASKTAQDFLCLLVDKKRIQYLADIVESYEDLTNEAFGFVKARVITATPLSSEDHEGMKKSLESITRKKILLSSIVDPRIIGGVIAEVGDKVFDGSVRNQLEKMRETLIYKG
jgi:F-type H+-transporting ATPase subunit delta